MEVPGRVVVPGLTLPLAPGRDTPDGRTTLEPVPGRVDVPGRTPEIWFPTPGLTLPFGRTAVPGRTGLEGPPQLGPPPQCG